MHAKVIKIQPYAMHGGICLGNYVPYFFILFILQVSHFTNTFKCSKGRIKWTKYLKTKTTARMTKRSVVFTTMHTEVFFTGVYGESILKIQWQLGSKESETDKDLPLG